MTEVRIIENNKEQILGGLETAIRRALESMGSTAESYTVLGAPVDTGRLASSITHQVHGNSVDIGTAVEYAPYVEFGHKLPSGGSVEGVHFLANAIMNHMDEYKALAEQALKGF